MSGEHGVEGIAGQMGRDRELLLRTAARIGLPRINGCPPSYNPKIPFEEYRSTYRVVVEKVAKAARTRSKAEFLKKCRKEYRWLRNWDREFAQEGYQSRQIKRRAELARRRVSREAKIVASLGSIAVQIRAIKPPKQITRIALLNAAGIRNYATISRFRDRWPQAFDKAERLKETLVEFSERRVRYAFSELFAAGAGSPTLRSVIEYAGLVESCDANGDIFDAVRRAYGEMLNNSEANTDSLHRFQRFAVIENGDPMPVAANG
jgi:hypothetical protein